VCYRPSAITPHQVRERGIVVNMSVCVSMYLCVCLSASSLYLPIYTCDLYQTLCVSPMAVTRSCFDSVAIRYVFPVLWMTSCFHIMVKNWQRKKRTLIVIQQEAARISHYRHYGVHSNWPGRSMIIRLPCWQYVILCYRYKRNRV